MDNHRISHLKRNVIACFALSLVLAGTAYASVKVVQRATAGITCSGRCPAAQVYWAYVQSVGTPGGLFGPDPFVSQTAAGGVPATVYHKGSGDWVVSFSGRDLSNCARFANLTSIRGSATVLQYSAANPTPGGVEVLTTNAAGGPFDADFVIGVFCGGGQGKISTGGLTG
jgi:hypothetical protein